MTTEIYIGVYIHVILNDDVNKRDFLENVLTDILHDSALMDVTTNAAKDNEIILIDSTRVGMWGITEIEELSNYHWPNTDQSIKLTEEFFSLHMHKTKEIDGDLDVWRANVCVGILKILN